MPAKLNFATIVRRDDLAASLRGVWPVAMGCLGPLETQSIQDFVAGTTRDSPLLDEVSVDSPAFTDNEIVAFYPNEMTRGSLILCHEDEFDVITLSIGGKADAEALAKRLWQSSSSVICVLAGEDWSWEDMRSAAF